MTDQLAHPGTAPVAAPRPIVRSHHGDDFADPYEWLRDKENPEVIAYLEAENAYTEARTEQLADLREAIFTDIKSRTKETDLSVPSLRRHTDGTGQVSGYWYYTRTVEGSEYAIHCRVAVTDPSTPPDPERPIDGEQVLLDGNLEAGDAEFFSIGAFAVSPDGTLLAYSTDLSGDERYTIKIKNLATGDLLPDEIEDTVYGVAWAGAGHLFYTRADDAWRPYLVRRHQLGTDPATDVDVFDRAGREVLGRAGVEPRRPVDPDRRRQQADHRISDPRHRHPGGRAALDRAAAPRRGVQRRGGRRPAADPAQRPRPRRRPRLRAGRGAAGRHRDGPVADRAGAPAGRPADRRVGVRGSCRCSGCAGTG